MKDDCAPLDIYENTSPSCELMVTNAGVKVLLPIETPELLGGTESNSRCDQKYMSDTIVRNQGNPSTRDDSSSILPSPHIISGVHHMELISLDEEGATVTCSRTGRGNTKTTTKPPTLSK